MTESSRGIRGEATSSEALLIPVSASTRELPASDQFPAWREILSGFVEVTVAGDCTRGFPAEHSAWTLGDVLVTRSCLEGAPARAWRHRPRSALDHWCLVLAQAPGSSASLSLRSLGDPFEGCSVDEDVTAVLVPRDLLAEEGRALEGDNRSEPRLDPAMAALLGDYLASLKRVLPTLPQSRAAGLGEVTRALLAACMRPDPGQIAAADRPMALLLAERARRVVRAEMANPRFGPNALGRALAVSRSKLYRLLEPHGGVARFIQRERLLEARRRPIGRAPNSVP
jgi:hypothetical protein